jgi:hypothetical protein
MTREFRNLGPARLYVPFALILLVGAAMPLWGQFTTARLGGVVTDPSGAVVAGATITVQDLGTGYTRTSTSTSAGQYLFPTLPVGNYQITVAGAGYRQYVQKGIGLSVARQPLKTFGCKWAWFHSRWL